MGISLVDALQKGWDRARLMLFSPFDLQKWLVLGFTGWLAGLGDGGGGGGSPGYTYSHPRSWDPEGLVDGASSAWRHLLAHTVWIPLIFLGLTLLVVIILAVLWLSSRGKFAFLDNVVWNRARVVDPWQRYAKQGDSLFLFRVGFALACIAAFTLLVILLVFLGGVLGSAFGRGGAFLLILPGVLMVAILGVAVAYLSFFLNAFVVPIMYRREITALAAWRVFLPRLWEHIGTFILAGLFVLMIFLLVGFAVVTIGLMTCCVGLLLVALPYVGTVILLPLIVTYRAFTLELLGQVDPELRLLGEIEEEPNVEVDDDKGSEGGED